MAVPFILGAAAAFLAGKGVKDGVKAHNNMKKAESLNQNAKDTVERANAKLEGARESTNSDLVSLGRTKISIMGNGIKEFADEYSKIKNVNLRDSVGLDELRGFDPKGKDFLDLKNAAISFGEIAGGGLGSIGAGALAAAGAYGAVGTFATASTGTAIAGLSGAAATNATLAWLGGGSLTAGGIGVAGGMVVLGGILLGPLFAVGGAFYASKAEKALNKANINLSNANKHEQEVNNLCSLLNAISRRSRQIKGVLSDLNEYLESGVEDLRGIIQESGIDWNGYSKDEKISIGSIAQIAKTVKLIVDTPLLYEDGKLNDQGSQDALDLGRDFIKLLA